MSQFERPLPTESGDIEEIARGILTLQSRYAQAQSRPLARGTHAKGICAAARFEVFDLARQIPNPLLVARLARGLYAHPGVYRATVRFANGDSQIWADRKADVRALSFSVQVPPGLLGEVTRLDFAMNNATTFPLNDARAFATTVRVSAAPTALKGFLPLSLGRKLQFLDVIRRGIPQKKRASRAYQQLRYWSTVPFRHGPDEVIKYTAAPLPGNPGRALDGGPDCLQNELVRHLSEDSEMAAFDFKLQFLNAAAMTHFGRRREPSFWVENAAIEWKESQAPFHTVARLTLLPRSQLTAAEAAALYIDVTEHATPETKPIGSINRARWAAESASRQARFGCLETSR